MLNMYVDAYNVPAVTEVDTFRIEAIRHQTWYTH